MSWLLLALVLNTAPAQEPVADTEAAQAPAAREEQITARVVLKVADVDATAAALIADVESKGGYFASYSKDEVVLRLPGAEVDPFLERVGAMGLVAERAYASRDLGGELLDLRARLKARNEVLMQFLALVPTAGPSAVVSVEREIVRLVSEIEGIQGRIRFLEHQARMAAVTVRFRFRDRTAPSRDGNSSFAWLNTLNVADVVDAFRYDQPAGARRIGITPDTPDGFSAYKHKYDHRAVSADEVLYRVRSEKHKPRADLPFWKESVAVRMKEAGYQPLREQDLSVGGKDGFFLEFTAPLGARDYVYGIAAFPVGGRLVVAEAVGEAARYEARREAILASMQALGL